MQYLIYNNPKKYFSQGKILNCQYLQICYKKGDKMNKRKKVFIIIISIVITWVLIISGILIFLSVKKDKDIPMEDEIENVEKEFVTMFSNIEYNNDESNQLISTVYEYKNDDEGILDINVHIPKFELETCEDINNEILEIFGTKLLDIVRESTEQTRYTVDYVYFVNDTIVSLIIKANLKEGSNPQRTIIKTYNYDVLNSENVSLEKILVNKKVERYKIQETINNTVREKNNNSQVLAEQGLNIYVRDIKSEEYKIENVENYLLNDKGEVYIIFAYGNKNFTETMDIIQVK